MIHIPLLLISLVSVALESAFSWYVIALWQPAAWFGTGVIFASAMFLILVDLILIGAQLPRLKLADYVTKYFGRTMLLTLIAIVLTGAAASGLEAVYQITPGKTRNNRQGDICFLLDCSDSMSGGMDGNSLMDQSPDSRRSAAHASLLKAIAAMDKGRLFCVVGYGDAAEVALDWTPVDDILRDKLPSLNDQWRKINLGGTDFTLALGKAETLVDSALKQGRTVTVVMLSDGEDNSSLQPTTGLDYFTKNKVKVDTISVGSGTGEAMLQNISSTTDGTFYRADSAAALGKATTSSLTGGNYTQDSLLSVRVRTEGILPLNILRPVFLFLLGLAIRLMGTLMMGRNTAMSSHVLSSALCGLAGALLVELGLQFGLPLITVLTGFWLITMLLIGRAET